jgi:DNA-directed RNA polymerase subunit RPC12/RpoP
MTYRESCSDECPDCGSRVMVGEAFCSSCGAEVADGR